MKIDIYQTTKNQYDYDYQMYITRGEFIKQFEKDHDKAFETLNYSLEMFTTPHCFTTPMSLTAFKRIYEHLSSTKYKGICFDIIEEYDYSTNQLGKAISNLQISLVKK